MDIAILGATSNIAKDLILNLISSNQSIKLYLFSRRTNELRDFFFDREIEFFGQYSEFSINTTYDVIFNFIGIGDPAKAVKMGANIIDITFDYDTLIINNLKKNPSTKYFFLSSGAAYGINNFFKNVDSSSKSIININDIKPQDWYAIAKLHAECRHRSMPEFSIIDIRVFNYINANLDINSRFLISDALRAILNKHPLRTSKNNIVRDYIGPDDFYNLIKSFLSVSNFNGPVDCFTKSPAKKFEMLDMLKKEFGLEYLVDDSPVGINSTGDKINYYSKNYIAKDYGYSPSYSSLETIKKEVTQILKNH